MLTKLNQRRNILALSFLVPVLIMGCYFTLRGMAPFGKSSILTVDLGQQYVDFYAYLRSSILHHPASLLYSFSKGLGGEMWGTNAYYLMSPLNLLLLFFPGASLSSGILFLLLIKYGLAGLSMAYLLDRSNLQSGYRLLMFSTPYALMGWMIANQLNMIWLDVLWLLPLVIVGLMQLLDGGRPWFYLSWLAITMIVNYYMAWMVCVFTILFTWWHLSLSRYPWRQKIRRFLRYVIYSCWSGLLSAVILLPTIYALTQSKGTYNNTDYTWKLEYNPLKLFGKLVPGSFNFSQMPSGQANIYVGMLMMTGFLLYFFNRRDRKWSRIIAALISIFLVASFVVQPLDLFWHLGQFPVWYPSRFSFLFSFWVIWLAARTLTPNFQLKWPQLLFILAISSLITVVLLTKVNSILSYINTTQIWIGYSFELLALIALSIRRHDYFYHGFLILLACVDVSVSAILSLNQISYVSQSDYGNYTTQLQQSIKKIKQADQSFYRIAKSFSRTKDDPFQADFYSGDHFGSTLEPSISKFMTLIGQPAGDGVISYANGTKITDSLLGFKYNLSTTATNDSALGVNTIRPDWTGKTIAKNGKITIKQNSTALPIAFGASQKILNLKSSSSDPTQYQSMIYQALAGKSTNQSLFKVQNFSNVTYTNTNETTQITGAMIVKNDPLLVGKVELTFTPQTNDPYYLTLGESAVANATIEVNGRPVTNVSSFRNTIIMNVANHQKGQSVKITFTLKKASLWLQNVSLYQLNQAGFQADYQKLSQSPFKISKSGSNYLTGTIKLARNQKVMMTTIPAAQGWHAIVDGHPAKLTKVINTFWALKLSPGKTHRITLYFIPPFLFTGLIMTIISLTGAIIMAKRKA